MASGLSVNRLIRVLVELTPLSAVRRNFGVLCIAADTDAIDPVERIRYYTDIDGVAQDHGITAEVYKAAEIFFSQSPRPGILAVARWVKTPTPAMLKGAILGTAEQDITAWTPITDGAFDILIDGVAQSVTGLDFSAQTNLNGVASVISANLSGAVCLWDGSRFTITTATAGDGATIGWASAPESGTDLSGQLKLTQALSLPPVDGVEAESPVACAMKLADLTSGWYGLMFADATITDAQHLDVSAAIEAMQTSRIYAVTITDTRVLDASYVADLASRLKELARVRTVCQYSENPYAIASFLGRAFTVNFNANRSMINMMYKQEPGIVPQYLTETQAQTLKNKRCNVFVYYDNDTAILQYGVMSGQAWFDERHGLDWLQNAVQNECYNLEYTSRTKIPQTDEGLNQFVNVVESVFGEGRNNGLIAPGRWNSDGFGQLERGQILTKGWYIYAPLMDDQVQSIREQRIAPTLQCAIKLAGAINEIDIIVSVNR
jgi:Protein of unknown function (DUF3383).